MTDQRLQFDEYAAELESTVMERSEPALFDDPSDELLWMALLICGDPIKAERAAVRVHSSLVIGNQLCGEWVAKSNRRATARLAIEEIRGAISKAAQHYSAPSFSTNSLDPLKQEQIRALHGVPVERIIAELDAFTRCVLALRGVLQQSIDDCAHLAQVGRNEIVAAYDHALGWLAYQQRNDSFWSDIRWDVNVFPVHHDDNSVLESQ